jgi:exodeoxyribonuclease VII large subunit
MTPLPIANTPQPVEPVRQIFSVSRLTENIKRFLEAEFPILWIRGEISNCRIPGSGHAYFTLKDEKAQIAAVMFRGQLRQLRFKLEDGVCIVGMGRLSVYEPRGTYQIILEYMEPQGAGALQIAFEQLKQKLQDEGLFAARFKAPLPYLPRKIGVITSASGAAVRDVLQIIDRRFPGMSVDVYPVHVQGDQAVAEIVRALELANQRADADVLILTRGGGSIEDLAAYNSEEVARAVFGSGIPVVSAVGHETDFTIADFVADFRAPTPSAAAEQVVPVKSEVQVRILELQARAERVIRRLVTNGFENLNQIKRSLIHPRYRVQQLAMRLDDWVHRLNRAVLLLIGHCKEQVSGLGQALVYSSPAAYLGKYQSKVELNEYKTFNILKIYLSKNRKKLEALQSALHAMNPKAVLERGYSITRKLPDRTVLTRSDDVFDRQDIEIILAQGELLATVKKDKDP